MKTRILIDDVNYIRQEVTILYDVPECIMDDSDTSQLLFDTVVEMTGLVQEFITAHYLTDEEIKEIDDKFKACIQKILLTSYNTEDITDLFTYTHCKIGKALELALDLECYETMVNIMKFQER